MVLDRNGHTAATGDVYLVAGTLRRIEGSTDLLLVTGSSGQAIRVAPGDVCRVDDVLAPDIEQGTAAAPQSIVRLRRDTAANWTAENPTLPDGQIGYETDTGKLKIGDGVTEWAYTPYLNELWPLLYIEARTDDPGLPAVGQVWLRTDL